MAAVVLGTKVVGEMGVIGEVVAMSNEWCVYKHEGREYAEPWGDIMAVTEVDAWEIDSSVTEKEI